MHFVYMHKNTLIIGRKRKLYLRDPQYSIPRQTIWISGKNSNVSNQGKRRKSNQTEGENSNQGRDTMVDLENEQGDGIELGFSDQESEQEDSDELGFSEQEAEQEEGNELEFSDQEREQ